MATLPSTDLAKWQRRMARKLGTGAQAIEFAIEHVDDHGDRLEFLKAWRDGSLADDDTEFDDYQAWLKTQRRR